MTSVSKAFKVELPEGQGTVCLTEQGLRVLRSKIDEEIGVPLTATRPKGVTLDEWDTFQEAMAYQRAARQKNEAANARLQGRTVAETARNIVTELNTRATTACPWPRRSFIMGGPVPDLSVALWESDGLVGRDTITVNQDVPRFRHSRRPENEWLTWSSLQNFATSGRRWFEVPVIQTPCSLADVDDRVALWIKSSGMNEGRTTIETQFKSDGGRQFRLGTLGQANVYPWVSWWTLAGGLADDRTWTAHTWRPGN